MKKARTCRTLVVALGFLLASPATKAADRPQWGECGTRNNASVKKGLCTLLRRGSAVGQADRAPFDQRLLVLALLD
jgi:hypothetical protein